MVGVLILSDCVVDLFYSIDKFPIGGNEVIVSRDFRISPGGACNVAVVLRKLGFDVKVLDRFGDDPLSNFLLSELRGLGINVQGRVERGFITISNNLIDSSGNHSFLGYVGTNTHLSPDELNDELIRDSEALFMNGFSLISLGTLRNAAIKALDLAIKYNKQVFFDVGPLIEPTSKLYSDLTALDYDGKYMLMNEDEAVRLYGRDLDSIIKELGNFSGTFIIKMGPKGAVIVRHGEVITCPAFKPRFVVNTVGAGDAFDAGFIAGILRGLSIADSCALANFVASIKLEHMSTVDMPSLNELRVRPRLWGLGGYSLP